KRKGRTLGGCGKSGSVILPDEDQHGDIHGKLVGKGLGRPQRAFEETALAPDGTDQVSPVLGQILVDALIEIVCAVPGDVVDDLQDAEGLLRHRILKITYMQELDMGLKELLDRHD